MIVQLNFAGSTQPNSHPPVPRVLAPRLERRPGRSSPTFPGTTPLGAFSGHRVLVLLDTDNIDFSLLRAGATLTYDALLSRFRRLAADVFPLAVLTAKAGDRPRDLALRAAGWRTVFIPHETVVTRDGPCVKGNADFDLAFEAGALAAVSGCTAACILSGDGDLAVAIARGLRRVLCKRRIEIHTLSVRGASSRRLVTRTDLFDSSITLGADLITRTRS